MDVRVTLLLAALACAFLTSCAMAEPMESSSDESDALTEASHLSHGLETIIDSIFQNLDDASAEDEDDAFQRSRRMFGGMHHKVDPARRFRNRPRVFIPRRRPGSRHGSRNNVSPY